MYASLFGAIGAAVDSETDTQQFMLPLTMPLVLSIALSGIIITNPNGSLAFWASLFPLTSPVVMMIRLPFVGFLLGVAFIYDHFDILIHRLHLAGRKNLPSRNSDVWQKSKLQGNGEVDVLQGLENVRIREFENVEIILLDISKNQDLGRVFWESPSTPLRGNLFDCLQILWCLVNSKN